MGDPGDSDQVVASGMPDQAQTPDPSNKADKPDKSAAELDVGWGERPRGPDRLSEEDERLLRERPPHWE